ncbi:MAG: glutamine synthetase III [Planctomycetaceae bacterium]|jgi:glutamine synthetase|nr:glutamine synthetase III [Planctomycetaceae bacterium]
MSTNIRRNALLEISSERLGVAAADAPSIDINAIFGKYSFSENVQKERLSPKVFRSLQETIRKGKRLDPGIADEVASAMLKWALELGATHYTHWFQPMTGSTAEKHDCFVEPRGDGLPIAKFRGSELIRGEPDASSFPSGGLRATFEARGYTAWDPTSPAFILKHKNGATLVIPTLFVSWTGEALDKKTPLLRSGAALQEQALRILRLFGNKTASRIESTMGAEQEYFLVDRRLAALRPDLLVTGRTLFGAKPPRGQELEDNYFGAIPERVLTFMTEVESELLLLGVPIKTRHNEVAPGQYELAPLFETANLATDHQMLIMRTLKSIAARLGFFCLLHEKPFAGVNGSGKHNNWSIGTDEGENLLEPGDTPGENAQFLVFCTAVIRAVHKYGHLLRMSVCGAGNDHRLGANEAPPAIISIFLGGALDEVYNGLAEGSITPGTKKDPIEIGVELLPPISRHSGDRNRTSPFAFTGNKFEFRAVGSSQSPAGSTTVINTIVAESLDYIATKLEAAVAQGQDLKSAVQNLIVEEVKQHKDVIYTGDCYTQAWKEEAAKRGLPNLVSTADCLPHINSKEAVELFTKYKIYTETELNSRFEIIGENYLHVVSIETATALEVAGTLILPAVFKYKSKLQSVTTTTAQKALLNKLDGQLDALITALDSLREKKEAFPDSCTQTKANYVRDCILPALAELRKAVDTLEESVDDNVWPLPTYTELLFAY